MPLKMGWEAKLYYCVAGIGGTPTWTEITSARNVTSNIQKNEVDVTTRNSGGWKIVKGGLREPSIEVEMPWDTSDAALEQLSTSFIAGTLLGIACMDGDIATAGSEGLWADMEVMDQSKEEPVEGVQMVKITLKPGYSANKPLWKKITS